MTSHQRKGGRRHEEAEHHEHDGDVYGYVHEHVLRFPMRLLPNVILPDPVHSLGASAGVLSFLFLNEVMDHDALAYRRGVRPNVRCFLPPQPE